MTTTNSTLTISIDVTSDLLQANDSLEACMYIQLGDDYTPAYGPYEGQQIVNGSWVYLWMDATSGDADYVPVGNISGANPVVPSFATYTSQAPNNSFALPGVVAVSGRIVFGVPTLPSIPIAPTGATDPPPSTAPTPTPGSAVDTPVVFDFVELTCDAGGVIYVDTTMIDQFGLPMQLQITPGASPNPLPNGSGVFLDRASVLTQFQTSVNAAFTAGTLDFFQQPIAAPLRILSASDVLSTNCVQSVSLGSQANTSTSLSLAAGTYYYVVTALDASGNESLASAIVASITIGSGQEVNISWPPASSQPQSSEIASYNVYRGVFPAGTWTPVANVAVTNVGGTATDQGQTPTPKSPPMSELATWFDSSIVAFFNYYDPTVGANTLTLTYSTAGYASASNVTWQYSFSGTAVTDSVTNLRCLQFLLTSVLDLSEATPTEVPASDLPFPLQTPFNIYYPYWNTNSFDPDAPAPAPYPDTPVASGCPSAPTSGTWMLNANWPASLMVFGASGVFADNIQQVYYNLPAGIAAPTTCWPSVPSPNTPAEVWQSLLASLENLVVSAITRGIAAPIDNASAPPITPSNWISQPTQLAPTAGSGNLDAGTYYYVVTTVDANGDESAVGLEMSITVPANSSVTIQWEALPLSQAVSFNIYRGTTPGGENTLVTNVTNGTTPVTSGSDNGGGTTQNPPRYYPSDSSADQYAAFFHQPTVSLAGAAYASPFDDDGNQSSTLSATPSSLSITVGPWS